jgi:hypothetical protein
MENPQKKWMMILGYPCDFGNLHMDVLHLELPGSSTSLEVRKMTAEIPGISSIPADFGVLMTSGISSMTL